jgi:5-methyltetrahydrofolate corrinoid/iron sulfur protein methyltransferase
MIIIGERIHIIAKSVREAIDNRDKDFIQDLAKRQVEAGAHMLDLNLGPMKKTGPEVMTWMVNAVQEVVDVPLSLDTTNAAAVETGLKLCKGRAMINSTQASEERCSVLMPLAAKYDADIIALTLRPTGLPVSADARVDIVTSDLMPMAEKYGLPLQNIYFDPLVLTVSGTQEHAPEVPKAAFIIKQLSEPSLKTVCGLSNVSNACPKEVRPVLNRIYLVMLMGTGMDAAIIDPFDEEEMEAIRIVENRDDSTPKGKLYLDLYDTYAAGDEFDTSTVDRSNPELDDIAKTIDVLQGKMLYAHGYLKR